MHEIARRESIRIDISCLQASDSFNYERSMRFAVGPRSGLNGGHCGRCLNHGELRLGGRACGYNSVRMALRSRKRIAPSLLVSAITKRTRPCLDVSA